ILLPHAIDFNYNAASPKYNKIAEIMHIDVSNMTNKQIKNALKLHIIHLNQQLGITSTLSDKGVTSDILPILAKKAIVDPCNATNPIAPQKKDLEVIYKESM
ncbi:MAG: iron-containing alcohol dehydrogenase, partial [Paludibacter sp.]